MIRDEIPFIENEADASANIPKSYRRLKWNELPTRGDFVADGHQGFELWQGPGGFRADAFVKPIYRRQQPAAARKSK